ncbi:MAG: hypothetical protein VZR53_18250 [Prevotella sp.]|nr:hypothetical protein [Prevotella sp.]
MMLKIQLTPMSILPQHIKDTIEKLRNRFNQYQGVENERIIMKHTGSLCVECPCLLAIDDTREMDYMSYCRNVL